MRAPLLACSILLRACLASAVALAALTGSLPGSRALAQEDLLPDLPMSEAAPLVDSGDLRVHLVSYGLVNGYLLETPAGITLVDAGLPASARTIERRLREIGRETELCQIYITHAHMDHFGAAAEIRERTGAPILVHEEDAADLAAGLTHLGQVRSLAWARRWASLAEFAARVRPAPADQTVVDGERLTACGLDRLNARVLLTPGHTAGHTALLITDPSTGYTYAFAADLVSSRGGAHMQSSYAQSWAALYVSVQRLQAASPYLTFPGHGSIALSAETLAALTPSAPIEAALRKAAQEGAVR